ncbi:hypothetical protein ACQJBY_066996 [Aegilops geniculata]
MLQDFFTLTEMKDGISTTARIAELVSEIQKLRDAADFSTADFIRQCSTAAKTLGSTNNEECLQHFVQLNGIGYLNQWLQDAQNCSKEVSSSAEEISQKARLLCQKWSIAPNCGENDRQIDAKEAYQAADLKPPEASQEMENNKHDGANEAATAEAKSNHDTLTSSVVPLQDLSLVNNNTDMTKLPPMPASPNSSDGHGVLVQVNSSVSSLASQGGLPNASVTEETSSSNDVGLVTNCKLSDTLNLKSDTGHVTQVIGSTIDAKSLENVNSENSFDSIKIDLGDQNVSSSLDIKKGNSFAAGQSCSDNAIEALNHLANASGSLQYSSEDSMGKEEGPTSSSGTDDKDTGSEFWLTRSAKSFGDSSKAAETKLNAVEGDKSPPSTEYDDTDALEVARLVAIEVEREVIDYRGDYCSSPDISSENVDSPHVEARQHTEPPVHESNENKSSTTVVDSGNSSSLKEDGVGITDDSGPINSRKNTQGVDMVDFDLNANQYHEETDYHPKSSANNSVNLSTPIAVAASRGSLVFPARLQFEGALGWKGSAATSAFRPASVPRTPDREKSMSASSQKTRNVMFDLNVDESENTIAGESLSTAFWLRSSDIAPKDISGADGASTGLELDLNNPCEEEAATTSPAVPSFWSHEQCHGRWSQPSSSSSSRQPTAKNFDLNDNVSFFDASSRGKGESYVKTSMNNTSDHSEVMIMGKRVTLGQKEHRSPNQYNFLGPSMESSLPVRSSQSYAHAPPDFSVFGYPSQPAAMSLPPPLYAPGGAPYMVDARGAAVVPPLPGLGVGISHPSFTSRTIQPVPSEFGYMNASMDFNYALSSEGARREAGGYWPVPFQGHTVFLDERMRSTSQGGSSGTGLVSKRKEPDSGWDIYPRH